MKQKSPSNPRTKADKTKIQKHIDALRRFNKWEANRADKMPDNQSLAVVFELYELVPEAARQRPVDTQGIIKMHKALACLK
ncbi:MAG: hypothetical protein K9J85_10590 [Desulfobacteraceae bacterium]|nr:hypothetical protein [Desulfobacteraceae bacterium]